MKSFSIRLLLICAAVLVVVVSGCARQEPNRIAAAPPAPGVRSIFVTGHRYHTGIAVRATDVPRDAWPARGDFPDAHYLDVGWGAREYYPADDPGIGLALRALFMRSRSALNVIPLNAPPASVFRDSEIIELHVSHAAFARMVDFVRQTHELDAEGRAHAVTAGANQAGRFYASPRTFHIFENCNVWVARALRSAGLSVNPGAALTAGMLLAQVRPLSAAAPATPHPADGTYR